MSLPRIRRIALLCSLCCLVLVMFPIFLDAAVGCSEASTDDPFCQPAPPSNIDTSGNCYFCNARRNAEGHVILRCVNRTDDGRGLSECEIQIDASGDALCITGGFFCEYIQVIG